MLWFWSHRGLAPSLPQSRAIPPILKVFVGFTQSNYTVGLLWTNQAKQSLCIFYQFTNAQSCIHSCLKAQQKDWLCALYSPLIIIAALCRFIDVNEVQVHVTKAAEQPWGRWCGSDVITSVPSATMQNILPLLVFLSLLISLSHHLSSLLFCEGKGHSFSFPQHLWFCCNYIMIARWVLWLPWYLIDGFMGRCRQRTERVPYTRDRKRDRQEDRKRGERGEKSERDGKADGRN